jgi:hypothetical protein
VLLVILVIGLLSAIIVVSLHTNAYIDYEEMHIKDLKVDEGISSSCSNSIIKKANDAAKLVKIDLKNEVVQLPNVNSKGDPLYLEYDEEGKLLETYEADRIVAKISEIKSNFDIEITNDYDSSILHISSVDGDITAQRNGESNDVEYKIEKNTYSFVIGNQQRIIDYMVYIYYSEGECNKLLTRKISFETPEFNPLYTTAYCVGKENLPNCQKYINSDHELSKNTYDLESIIKDIEKTDARKYKERSLANNKVALIIVSVIVIILLVVAIVVVVIGVKKVRRGGVLHENEIDNETDEDKSEAFEEYAKEENEKNNK